MDNKAFRERWKWWHTCSLCGQHYHGVVCCALAWACSETLYKDPAATLDDLREAVTTLEDADPIARRVLGSSNPVAIAIEFFLRQARAALQVAQRRPVV